MWRQLTDYEKTCWADGRSLWFTLSLACGLSSSAGLIRSLTKEGGLDLAKFVVLEPRFWKLTGVHTKWPTRHANKRTIT
jgi:hypothetical protein